MSDPSSENTEKIGNVDQILADIEMDQQTKINLLRMNKHLLGRDP